MKHLQKRVELLKLRTEKIIVVRKIMDLRHPKDLIDALEIVKLTVLFNALSNQILIVKSQVSAPKGL